MKKWLATGLVLAWGAARLDAAPFRVACVGDSITFGAYLPQRDVESYPARLQALANGAMVVTNLGDSGHTLIKAGRLSWWNSTAFNRLADFQPDAVVVMLGTCDIAEPDKLGAYESDLCALVDHFASLASKPRVWLATPPPIPALRKWKLNWRLNHRVIPAIRRVAQRPSVAVIDVNAALRGRPELFPDDLHPNAEGADVIARTVWESMRGSWGADFPSRR